MSTRDPSLFGWLLPEPGQLHPIGELLFVAIGYGFLLWLIIKLMKHFLSSKPWHKWLRRGIWSVLAVLMFIDPFYYYFGIVRGYCAEDQARVYPAPPASYVLAGPMPYDELKNVDTTKYKKTYRAISYWECNKHTANKVEWCVVRDVQDGSRNLDRHIPFGFKKDVISYYSDSFSDSIYGEFYLYEGEAHWITELLFGVKMNWLDYREWGQCSSISRTERTIINLD